MTSRVSILTSTRWGDGANDCTLPEDVHGKDSRFSTRVVAGCKPRRGSSRLQLTFHVSIAL